MQLLITFFFVTFACMNDQLQAQFFYKMDDDFKFNGLNLARFHNDDPLKGCTLIEHTDWGDMYKPAKEELKTKGFTLQNIRYYTDLTEQPYVWLITAITTRGIVDEAIIRGDMANSNEDEKSWDVGDRTWHSYRHMRTYDVYSRRPNSDTADVYIVLRLVTDQASDYLDYFDFIMLLGMDKKQEKLRNYIFYCGLPDKAVHDGNTMQYSYYARGTELTIINDTLAAVTIYNRYKNFQQYQREATGTLPITYMRAHVDKDLGTPFWSNENKSVCRYHHYDSNITVVFSNDETKAVGGDSDTIESILFRRKK